MTSSSPDRRVKLGISLGEYGPHASPERIIARAALAEELGLDCVWVSDRVVVPAAVDTCFPYARHDAGYDPVSAEVQHEALMTMSWVAACTERVGVGVSVLALPLREPMLLARQLATLAAFAEGRVIMGVGVGWMREEFEIAAPGTWSRRGQLTDDYLELLDRLWKGDGEIAYQGEAYQSRAVRFEPKPTIRPRIEVGGNSRVALSRAARFGDAWHALQLDVRELRLAAEALGEIEETIGRTAAPVSITLRCGLDSSNGNRSDAPAWHLGGSDERIADHIGQYVDAGVETFVFDLQPEQDESAHRDQLERVSALGCGLQYVPR